ncbi:uncharacterized protein METZ01_LOCUS200216 [marine metagenome]|uniref:Uncharacterized protein n=1 Tax=marine metagenome TaxID=408172 RepID=A0A382EAK7_9ZZZZ
MDLVLIMLLRLMEYRKSLYAMLMVTVVQIYSSLAVVKAAYSESLVDSAAAHSPGQICHA